MTIIIMINFDNNNYRTDHQVNFCKTDNKISNIGKGLPRKDSKGTCLFPRSSLQTAIGTVNGKEVRVLRDAGCTGVVVRWSLVSDGQTLNK